MNCQVKRILSTRPIANKWMGWLEEDRAVETFKTRCSNQFVSLSILENDTIRLNSTTLVLIKKNPSALIITPSKHPLTE